jgi:hypothetical protein
VTRRVLIVLMLVIHPVVARACPVCDSDTGRQVRDGIFDGNIALHAIAVALPVAAVAGAAGIIHFGGRRPPTARRRN